MHWHKYKRSSLSNGHHDGNYTHRKRTKEKQQQNEAVRIKTKRYADDTEVTPSQTDPLIQDVRRKWLLQSKRRTTTIGVHSSTHKYKIVCPFRFNKISSKYQYIYLTVMCCKLLLIIDSITKQHYKPYSMCKRADKSPKWIWHCTAQNYSSACRGWGSHSGGYKVFYLLGYNAL
jgi:hypothetical protein